LRFYIFKICNFQFNSVEFPKTPDRGLNQLLLLGPGGIHTPQTFLNHGLYFLEKRDYNQSCEKIWMAASLALKITAAAFGIQYSSHIVARKFCKFLGEKFSTLGRNWNNKRSQFEGLFSEAEG
jgi:hypothetical protein